MRLWSLHPSYLDHQGLVSCWREGLLAKKALEVSTQSSNNPQLIRFRETPEPLMAINAYLGWLVEEADERGYKFELAKLQPVSPVFSIEITAGQLDYELKKLLQEVATRDPVWRKQLVTNESIKPNPRFTVVQGGVADWEAV